MEGGIAILLLLIIVAAVIGIALYFTGGALWFSKAGEEDEGSRRSKRPEHKAVTNESIENTKLAGTRQDR